MNRAHLLLIAALCVLAPGHAQAQALPGGREGVALTQTPAVVVVVAHSADARVALVREAVAHWNRVLAGMGSSFRLGPVSIRSGGAEAAEPGKIVVLLSDGVFISHVDSPARRAGCAGDDPQRPRAAAVAAQYRSQCDRT